jgi:hypothetical protein
MPARENRELRRANEIVKASVLSARELDPRRPRLSKDTSTVCLRELFAWSARCAARQRGQLVSGPDRVRAADMVTRPFTTHTPNR